MAKKIKTKKAKTDAGTVKAVKKAIAKETTAEPFGAEWIANVANDIILSPIPEAYKAMFLYAIVQGTFNADLYDVFIRLLREEQVKMSKEIEVLQQEQAQLEEEYEQVKTELPQALIGAAREVETAVTHIENRTATQLEKMAGEKEAGKIEKIKEKLKKK